MRATLPSIPNAYLGAFEPGAPPSYQPVQTFAATAGQPPNLVGYYSGWAEPFATRFAQMISRHHMTPLVQIDPTYASVADIAAGDYDRYLSSYADSVRDFGRAVVIGFGHEMNAPWYSWGYGHVPSRTFVAAWRHIVTLFRAEGARNVVWLWTINADQPGTGPVASWWPGDAVRQLGRDRRVLRQARRHLPPRLRQHHPRGTDLHHRPVLIAETSITPQANQFAEIGDLFHGLHTLPGARASVVRLQPARRYRAPGLAHRGQQHRGAGGFPAGRNPAQAGQPPAGPDRSRRRAGRGPPASRTAHPARAGPGSGPQAPSGYHSRTSACALRG